jgi:hypothetical protein
MSITSALIANTIDKIKKDLYQLEDWLNSLHSGSHSSQDTTVPSNTNVADLLKKVEELTIEVNAQKHTIHHLVDRLDVMEETREIHIDAHLDDEQDPWLSGPIPLQNEIVDPTFFIHKTEEVEQPVVQIPPVVEEKPIVETKAVEAPPIIETKAVEEAEQQEPQEEEEQEEEQEAEQEEAEPVESKDEEQQEEEQEEAQEDEEEGVELEEITVKGVNYYKDPEEGFIYEIDSEGQPSEQPVGVWKTKTQTISFYRST